MPYIGNNLSSTVPPISTPTSPRDPGRFDGAAFAQMLAGGLRTTGSMFTGGGLELLLSGAQGLGGGGTSDQLELQQLINRQMESQMKMQVFSAKSNIEKTEHDTRMTAIQNMRA